MPFPVENVYIIETEQSLGVKFSSSYREAMSADNGGEVATDDDDWQLFPFRDKSDQKKLARTSNDIIRENQSVQTTPGFPSNALAIAANGMGDYLVFLKNGVGMLSAAVFLWNHETGEMEKIADDFADLNKA